MKIRRFTRLSLTLLSGILAGAALYAQTPRSAAPAANAVGTPSNGKVKKTPITFEGLVGDYKETKEGRILTGDGAIKIVSPDMTLTTDKALWNDTTKVATSPGKLKIEDPNNTLTGNTGTAYYTKKKAQVRGNVVINARPKPNLDAPEGSPRRELNAPTTITCEAADYDWGSKVADVTGNLKLVQKDRTVTADKGKFETKADRVTLEGHVVYTKADGERGKAEKVVVIITEGKEQFTAYKVTEATVMVEEEPETPDNSANGGKPATPPPGGEKGGNTGGPGNAPPSKPATPPTTDPGKPDPAKPDPTKPDPSKPNGNPPGGANP